MLPRTIVVLTGFSLGFPFTFTSSYTSSNPFMSPLMSDIVLGSHVTLIDVNDLLMDALISGPVSLSSRAVEI